MREYGKGDTSNRYVVADKYKRVHCVALGYGNTG